MPVFFVIINEERSISSIVHPKKRPKEIGTLLRTLSEDDGTLSLLQLQVRNERMVLIPHRNSILTD